MSPAEKSWIWPCKVFLFHRYANRIFVHTLALPESLLTRYNTKNLKACSAMETILDDTLDYSKIESGQFTIAVTPGSLRNLVSNTISTMTPFAQDEEKRVNLDFHCDDAIPDLCLFDVGRLQQVLANLISNSIKFSKHDGTGSVHLSMKTCVDGDDICMKG